MFAFSNFSTVLRSSILDTTREGTAPGAISATLRQLCEARCTLMTRPTFVALSFRLLGSVVCWRPPPAAEPIMKKTVHVTVCFTYTLIHEHCFRGNKFATSISFVRRRMRQRVFRSCVSVAEVFVMKFVLRNRLYFCVYCLRRAGSKSKRQSLPLAVVRRR